MWRAAVLLCLASVAAAHSAPDPMAGERAMDRRLASLTDRLARAAVARCADRQGSTGLVLHTADEYQPAARVRMAADFRLGDHPGVLALVPGSPAEQAGVRLDDEVLAADGSVMPVAARGSASYDTVAAVLDTLDKATADGRVTLSLRGRDGGERTVSFDAPPACRVRPVLLGDRDAGASTDGVNLKVTTGLLAEVPDDDELSAAIAHELAHIVLRHPQAIRAAGGRGGLVSASSAKGARVRRTEEEADRLSVALLTDAGIDPRAAVTLWREWGRRSDGLFGDPVHGGWDERVRTIEAAIAALPTPRAAPTLAAKETPSGE